MEVPAEIAAARAKLKEKLGTSGQQMGGKGTARRKTKKVHKSAVEDERKIQQVLKRIGTSDLAEIEEVKMIQDNGKTLFFEKPKVHAAPASNTYVVTGAHKEGRTPTEALTTLFQEIAAKYSAGDPQLDAFLRQHMPGDGNPQDPAMWDSLKTAVGAEDVPTVMENFDDVAKED